MIAPGWTPEVSAAFDARMNPPDELDLTLDEIKDLEDSWEEQIFDEKRDRELEGENVGD